jgi:uncharacterized protein YndB with AHSA1/START domain
MENQSDRELFFERLLNAPRELVFMVWTDPEHIVKWWGPNGFTNTNHGMDVSENGVWRFTMHGPDGVDYKNKIMFLEVVEPERLVYKHCGDENTEPVYFQVTVTFEARGNQTYLTMRMVFETKEELERVAKEFGAIEGAYQHMARLEAYVSVPSRIAPNPLPFRVQRTFSAPQDLVFDMFRHQQHLSQWWGPKGMAIKVLKLDFRPGGMFHYSMVAENGYTMWGRFDYLDIVIPKKIVWINSFADQDGKRIHPPFPEPWPAEMYNVAAFTGTGAHTQLTLMSSPIHATPEERETFIRGFSSMQEGFKGTFDQLEEYLAGA